MTDERLRELLKQESETMVERCTPYHVGSFVQGFIAGAEPREKRIEELEQQIEKMKCCWNCKFGENSENKLPCSSCNKNWIVRKRLKKLSDKWEIKENE